MSPAPERRTLARLSVAAGSAMTLAAAWVGVLRVEQPAVLSDGAEANRALSQEMLYAATPAPTALPSSSSVTVPAPAPGVAGRTVTDPATATARTVVTSAASVPAAAPPTVVTPAVATPAVTPATTPGPVPTPRIVTRRSRAS